MKYTLKFSRRNNKVSAFTLIELLLVFAIILLLTSIVLASVTTARIKANDVKIKEDLRQVKNALELYYSKYNSYPPTALNSNNPKNIGHKPNSNTLNPVLGLISKTADAYTHTNQLCKNFDILAGKLVSEKLISTIPVHPYDDDTKGICYKAYSNQKTIAAFAPLAGSSITDYSGAVRSKRYGIVLGQSDISSLNTFSTEMHSDTSFGDSSTPGYPSTSEDVNYFDLSQIADEIEGITQGQTASGFDSNSNNNTNTPDDSGNPNSQIPTDSNGHYTTCASTNGWCNGLIPNSHYSLSRNYGPSGQTVYPNYFYSPSGSVSPDGTPIYSLVYCPTTDGNYCPNYAWVQSVPTDIVTDANGNPYVAEGGCVAVDEGCTVRPTPTPPGRPGGRPNPPTP